MVIQQILLIWNNINITIRGEFDANKLCQEMHTEAAVNASFDDTDNTTRS